MQKEVMDVYIEPSVLTEHTLIYISVNFDKIKDQDKRIGTGYWKLDNTLLEDEQILSMAKLTSNENWRKSKAHFFNLEKRNAETTIIKLDISGQITDNAREISNFVKNFYENLHKKKLIHATRSHFSVL